MLVLNCEDDSGDSLAITLDGDRATISIPSFDSRGRPCGLSVTLSGYSREALIEFLMWKVEVKG